MEFNSKYYHEFITNMQNYDVPPEAYDYASDFQVMDELMFGFNMFLLV